MNAKHPSQSWQKAPLLTSCPNLHLGSHLWFLIFSFISPPNTKQVSQQVLLLQDGEPLPGPGRELLSNTQKWIVQGDTHADKARDFVGKRHLGREQEGKGIQENCSAMWVAVLGFYGDGISFWVVSCQSFRLRVLSGGTCIAQPRWIPMRMILEGGRTRGSLWPFPNSPGW